METNDFASNLQHTTALLRVQKRERDINDRLTGRIIGGTGTGFFFEFPIPGIPHHLKTIVTNRHVMRDYISLEFTLNHSIEGDPFNFEQNSFTFNEQQLSDLVVFHPNDDIDLCYIDLSIIFNEYLSRNIRFRMNPFSFDSVPSQETYHHFNALEEVVMIGYPFGLWDHVNNLPIMRKGHTASHVYHNYLGREDFLVNIPAYHGSSGSPLVIMEEGSVIYRSGELFNQTRCLLLGIQKEIPRAIHADQLHYSNLGIFIKSYKLYDFLPIIEEIHRDDINRIRSSMQNETGD